MPHHRNGGIAQWALVLLVGLALIGGGLLIARRQGAGGTKVSAAPTSAPAAAPSTAPATAPATVPIKPVEYMDVVRLNYPDFPTTQPLIVPAAMQEAARLVINDPIYLDAVGELWITRADAESNSTVLKEAPHQSTHVTREQVAFVHRWP